MGSVLFSGNILQQTKVSVGNTRGGQVGAGEVQHGFPDQDWQPQGTQTYLGLVMAAEKLVEVEFRVLLVILRTHHAGESHLGRKGLDTAAGYRRSASRCLDHHIVGFDRHVAAADTRWVWEEVEYK